MASHGAIRAAFGTIQAVTSSEPLRTVEQSPRLVFEVRAGERVVLPDLGGRTVVQDHVHLGQGAGGVVHLLPVQGQVVTGQVPGHVVGLQQQ